MKCCNRNCNQGRWCEVHRENAEKRVDKMKKILYTITLNYNIAEIIAIGAVCILLKV
jgi:hypothetical protein